MNRERMVQLWRIALSIQRQAEHAAQADEPIELPGAAWDDCRRLAGLAQAARRRGWLVAAGRARRRLARALGDCRRQLAASEESLAEAPPRVPATREIFEDLAALEREFGRVRVDLQAKQLAVLTEPIVLDGMSLGQFDVVLNWSQATARSGAYGIESVDGRPANVDSDVIHPHVRDGSLCEGEARPAILAALAGGRALDFFSIVAQTLATYNPHNAFVTLDDWRGVTCADCGSVTDDDDRTSCERCQCDLCDPCAAGCQGCGFSLCGDCSAICQGCQDGHCRQCLNPCPRCGQRFCERCLINDQCEPCREAAADPTDGRTPDDPQALPAQAPPDAVCVG